MEPSSSNKILVEVRRYKPIKWYNVLSFPHYEVFMNSYDGNCSISSILEQFKKDFPAAFIFDDTYKITLASDSKKVQTFYPFWTIEENPLESIHDRRHLECWAKTGQKIIFNLYKGK